MFGVVGRAIGGAAGWMLKNPVFVLLAIFAAMFVMVVMSKNAQISELRTAIDDPKTGWRARNEMAQQVIGGLRASNASLTASVQAQNAGIEALRAQGAAASERFDTLIASMANSNANISRKITAIDRAQPGPDKCASALEILKGAAL